MKFTLRVTLLTILLTLILLTVAALGSNAYRNARFTAEDLSQQILEQTSLRIDDQINDLLYTANKQGLLNQALLQSAQFDSRDFSRLAAYWLEVMKVHTRLTRLSLGLEATGEWFYVRRLLNGKLAVGELRRNPRTDKLELSDYWPEDYPRRRFAFEADKTNEDPRTRPWYVAARQAGKQAWSETYIFSGTEGIADVPGVSCATPLYAADGSLQGVLTSSFDLFQLCTYLKDLHVGEHGYAFVVEYRTDGSRRVIAHPQPDILLRAVPDQGKDRRRELVPSEELSDLLVGTFLDQLPPGLNPSALQGTTPLQFRHDGIPYLGSYHCLTSRETPNWLIGIILPEADVLARVNQSNREALFIGFLVLAAAFLVSWTISRQVARPLEQLARETEAIGRLQVEPRPVAHSLVREVDRLARATEETKTSLRSFQKYVPAHLVRQLLASGQEALLGGENRTVTVYFCDLADFTSVAEHLAPADLVRHLSDYFGTFSSQILATGGTVDKYVGDAIMAFWGAPAEHPGSALAACTTALRNQTALQELRGRWQAEGKPLLFARIGIHTGEVLVGNIGSPARLNYTVMGDAVNLANRLEGLNKYYGTQVLVSARTFGEAQPAVLGRPVDWVSAKGKSEAVLIYELLALKDAAENWCAEVVDLSVRALDRYRSRDWASALALFETVLRLRPEDGPARLLATRCRTYQAHPPVEDWDGVQRMESK